MKIRIYHRYGNEINVFVETETSGWYMYYWNKFSNPSQVSRKLKHKKLSIKFITKLFQLSPGEYSESEIDRYIKQCKEHIVSYDNENKNIS
jgi:hypothetical protein